MLIQPETMHARKRYCFRHSASMFDSVYASARLGLILANLNEPPDTHHIISKKNAFGFKLLSTRPYSVLKQSFIFLQQKYNLRPYFH